MQDDEGNVRMTVSRGHSGTGIRLPRVSRLLPVLVLALLLLGAGNAFAITRGTVLARAQKWVDIPIKYSQTKYYGGYRTDCSGFASMTWQLGRSLTTRSLHNVAHRIPLKDLKPGDAMLAYDYHVRIFYGWADAEHKYYVTYEQTGPTTKSSIKSLSEDYYSKHGYRAYRLDTITDGPPAWNALANDSFNVWASGRPVWWESGQEDRDDGHGPWSAWSPPAPNLVKEGKSALRLVNASSRTEDVSEVRQTAAVKAGTPYTATMWARSDADPAGLELRLTFFDAVGTELAKTATTGDAWGVNAAGLKKMSLTAIAPAEAASATVSVRLSGAIDASGVVAASAILDYIRLYDATPAASTCTVSKTSVEHAHSVTLRGRVTAPVAVGTVRIYMVRPGKKTAVFLADRPLVGGAWSMAIKPTVHGTYTFTAKYLGYGPYGPVTSERVSLRVK